MNDLHIKTKIKGLDEVIRNLDKEKVNIQDCILKGMDKALDNAQAQAKALAPVKDGYLRENIFKDIHKNSKKIEGCIYGDAEYHVYVEMGTGPTGNGTHPLSNEVTYKTNKWKVKIPQFVGKNGKKDIGIRYISGQKAQPHMYPAFLTLKRILIDKIKQESGRYR